MKKLILLLLLLVPACLSAQTVTDLSDPGSNGVVKRTALGITGPAASSDLIALWTGTCNSTTFLRADGSCQTAGAVSSVFSRTGAVVAVANDYTFDLIGAGSNLNALSLGNAGSLKPLNLGQIAGSQVWLQPTLSKSVQANFSAINSGGSIGSGQVNIFQYTLNSALGETTPNQSFQINMVTAGCTVGSCTLTMAAPTIPSGYTGWTMYWCDTSAGCTVPVKVLACVNISTSCSVTNQLLNSGILPPTSNTAVITPPNVQATECPPGVVASMFSPDASGNYHTWGGMLFDSNQTVPRTTGTPVICHSTFFTDQMANPVSGNNAFVAIVHNTGVNTDQVNNQERALWLNITNPTGDTTQHYSITSLQAETDVLGNPTWTGQPDAEAVTGSFQLSDQTTGVGVTGPNGGVHTIRADYFKSGAGSFSSGTNYVAVQGKFIINNSAFSAGDQAPAFSAHCVNSVGGTINNLFCMGMKWVPPTGTITNGTAALYEASGGPTGTNDWFLRNDTAVKSLMSGTLIFSGINNSAANAAMTVNAAENVQASLTVTQGTIPQPASASCSGGASTYSYQLVGVDNNGGTVAGTQANCATGVNPLTGVNPANITITNTATTVAQYAGFVRIDVYRTAGPMATGKIGSLTCSNAAGAVGPSCSTFSDTGLAATTAVPTVNTTGGATIGGDFTLGTSKGQHLNTQAANSDTAGTCTLGTNCVVTFTRAYTAAPVCVATDTTAAAAVRVVTTTGGATFTGTGTDVLAYICTGNPN